MDPDPDPGGPKTFGSDTKKLNCQHIKEAPCICPESFLRRKSRKENQEGVFFPRLQENALVHCEGEDDGGQAKGEHLQEVNGWGDESSWRK